MSKLLRLDAGPSVYSNQTRIQAHITFYRLKIINCDWYENYSEKVCDHESLVVWPLRGMMQMVYLEIPNSFFAKYYFRAPSGANRGAGRWPEGVVKAVQRNLISALKEELDYTHFKCPRSSPLVTSSRS